MIWVPSVQGVQWVPEMVVHMDTMGTTGTCGTGDSSLFGCDRYHAYHGYQKYLRGWFIWIPGIPWVPKEGVYIRAMIAMSTRSTIGTNAGGQ